MGRIITTIRIDEDVKKYAKMAAKRTNYTFAAYYEDLILNDLKNNHPELFKMYNPKLAEPENPLIIKSGGTWVAHWEGVDYLLIKNQPNSDFYAKSSFEIIIIDKEERLGKLWKPFSEIEKEGLTDEIAKLRPMVYVGLGNDIFGQLYGLKKDDHFPCLVVLPDEVTSWYRNGRLATPHELEATRDSSWFDTVEGYEAKQKAKEADSD